MQTQAPVRLAQPPFRAVARSPLASARLVPAVSALLISSALAGLVGCGSGILGTVAPPQSLATPVASAKGPQLGYLWVDSDKTLRPILGVAGASLVGQSVVPAGIYTGASASATAGIAVLQGTDGTLDAMTLPSGSPASLGFALPTGARIRLSPGATTALVYTPGATTASLVSGLNSTPIVHTVTTPAAIADSAVSDSGAISYEYAQGSSFAVAALASGGQPTSVGTVKSIGGLNFVPGHDDLLFADAAANSLTLVRSATTSPSTSVVQTAQLLNAPSAVGISGSGRWALVVNSGTTSGNPSLVRVDLSTLATTSITCSCKPTLASTLADDGAFRVTDSLTGPNWIVDAAAPTPRLVFIPGLPPSSKTSLIAAVVP